MSNDYIPDAYEDEDKSPHSIEGEQAVLGILITDSEKYYPEIRDILKPEHFYDPVHQKIAKVVFTLCRRGRVANEIIVKQRFERDNALDEIGGASYLTLLKNDAPSGIAVQEYANFLSDLAGRRQVIELAQEALRSARNPDYDGDCNDLCTSIKQGIEIVEGIMPASAQFITMREASRLSINAIGQERAMGLPTGFMELDEKLAGLGRGKLITVGGRPSMGKTSLVTNIARAIAKAVPGEDGDRPGRVGFFSQEMPAEELGERSASAILGKGGGVKYRDITAHNVTTAQKGKLLSAIDIMPDFLIDPTGGLTVSEIMKRSRAMEKRMGGLDLIVIDYLQLMEFTDCSQPKNAVSSYGEITKKLKQFAKELNIAVVLVCQLSREVDKRESHRPRMADLRGSGDIEQNSDVILFVYRKQHYLEEAGAPEKQSDKDQYYAELADCKNKMDIIISKNKGGPKGTISLRCFLPYDVITELADETGEGFQETLDDEMWPDP